MRELEPLRPEREDMKRAPARSPQGSSRTVEASIHGEAEDAAMVTADATAAPREWSEEPIVMQGCQGPMIGILARPRGEFRTALLIVAGQPQTRVGAHRMFTELARHLADSGVASLRFDVGGWGDSPGEALQFERSGSDIALAAAALRAACPASVKIWLWGLCDGASAAVLALPALQAAGIHPAGLCLVNPWVRSEASLADAMVRSYYLKRLLEGEFWSRLLRGQIPLENMLREPMKHLKAKFGPATRAQDRNQTEATPSTTTKEDMPRPSEADLPSQLLACLSGYRGDVCTVLSGKDLTAAETDALMARDKRWRKRIDRRGMLLRVPEADHTFSTPEHWSRVSEWIAAQANR
jgi:exosortase A-associated hydrolase 1